MDELELEKARDRRIVALELSDVSLVIRFEDGSRLLLQDLAQHCCERRYMSTDDTLTDYVGALFRGATLADVGHASMGDDDFTLDVHDVVFLNVQTSEGEFQIVNHNEHNGYYGGFDVTAKFIS